MATPSDELLWTAYRYSAGELAEPELSAFEALLGESQAAREALALSVGLSEAVCSVEREALVVERAAPIAASAGWYRSAGWVAVAVAACLALMFVSQRLGPQDQPAEVAVKVEPVDSDADLLTALLVVSHAGAEQPNDEASSVLVPSVVDVGPEETNPSDAELAVDEPGVDESSLDDPNATPDWLLAAVAESQS